MGIKNHALVIMLISLGVEHAECLHGPACMRAADMLVHKE